MPWSTFIQVSLIAAGLVALIVHVFKWSMQERDSATSVMGLMNKRMMEQLDKHASRADAWSDKAMGLVEAQLNHLHAMRPESAPPPPTNGDIHEPDTYSPTKRRRDRRRDPEPDLHMSDEPTSPAEQLKEALDTAADFEAQARAANLVAERRRKLEDEGVVLVNSEDV